MSEADHPAAQTVKRELPDAAAPASATFVPADFETGRLRECAVQSGLDPFRPVFASWLGVTTHPTHEAAAGTAVSRRDRHSRSSAERAADEHLCAAAARHRRAAADRANPRARPRGGR
jgi:O-methyltransferase involved in polyketide biosynthesis